MNEQQDLTHLDPDVRKRVNHWLAGDYDEETKAELRRLLHEDPQQVTDAFYTSLSFGTGGLRGIMGIGTNRMNAYTVRFATQGLANYLKQQEAPAGGHAVYIGYDCRHDSDTFALEAARVLAGNGIRVYLSEALRPTPLISFGARLKGCSSAIMITASHNPPEYNGYKVYWNDGAQILPPHDSGIIEEVRRVSGPDQVQLADENSVLIERVGSDIDTAYLDAIETLQHYPERNQQDGKQLNIVFTNLHGTAITLVPDALARWGFHTVSSIAEQERPDGDFPTVRSPNPEERDALELGIQKLTETQADLLMGCDPDADRMGAVVLHQGEAVALTGNQIACLCLAHICEALESQQRLPANAAFVKTIVTTELFRVIAEDYGKKSFDVLTGFKYVAEKIREWEEASDGYTYLFGGEESYGYLLGSFARDKDAVVSCCLMAEAALHAKLSGKTLVDKLYELYRKYGVYREELLSLKFPETKEGRQQMADAMVRLREAPPSSINGSRVVCLEDYLSLERRMLETGSVERITLPKSNILAFWLADGTKVVVRPSGTEPKVKLYCGAVTKEVTDLTAALHETDQKTQNILSELKTRLLDSSAAQAP